MKCQFDTFLDIREGCVKPDQTISKESLIAECNTWIKLQSKYSLYNDRYKSASFEEHYWFSLASTITNIYSNNVSFYDSYFIECPIISHNGYISSLTDTLQSWYKRRTLINGSDYINIIIADACRAFYGVELPEITKVASPGSAKKFNDFLVSEIQRIVGNSTFYGFFGSRWLCVNFLDSPKTSALRQFKPADYQFHTKLEPGYQGGKYWGDFIVEPVFLARDGYTGKTKEIDEDRQNWNLYVTEEDMLAAINKMKEQLRKSMMSEAEFCDKKIKELERSLDETKKTRKRMNLSLLNLDDLFSKKFKDKKIWKKL